MSSINGIQCDSSAAMDTARTPAAQQMPELPAQYIEDEEDSTIEGVMETIRRLRNCEIYAKLIVTTCPQAQFDYWRRREIACMQGWLYKFFGDLTYTSRVTIVPEPSMFATSNSTATHRRVDSLMMDFPEFEAWVQNLRLEVHVTLGVPFYAALQDILSELAKYEQLRKIQIVMYGPSTCQDSMLPYVASQLAEYGASNGLAVEVEFGWYYDAEEGPEYKLMMLDERTRNRSWPCDYCLGDLQCSQA